MNVLVAGFEAFDGGERNPSAEIAQALDGRMIAGHRVVGTVLPCVFGASVVALKRQLRRLKPQLVICLGLANGRSDVTPERVAINVDDARIPDNAGAQPVDQPVIKSGPTAYFSTLPGRAIVAELMIRGIPASLSNSAGTYVCNHVFYSLMHHLRRKPQVRGGFIHVPCLPEQAKAAEPSLPLYTLVEAIALAVEVSLRKD